MASEEVKGGCGCMAILAIIGIIVFFVIYIPKQKQAWSEVQKANTVESYQKYLDEHSWGWYRSNARERLKQFHDEAWAKAQREMTPEAFNEYLRRFPQGERRKDAEDVLLKLHDIAWKELESRSPPPTALDYDGFLRNFPNSPHAPPLRQKIESEVWTLLQTKPDARAADFQSYIQTYPNSRFITQAKQQWHDLWWKELQSKVQSPEAYKKFIEAFPNSQYVTTARPLAEGFSERSGTSTSIQGVNRRMQPVQEFDTTPEQTSTYESVYERRPKPKSR
jgi:hypothetical protein